MRLRTRLALGLGALSLFAAGGLTATALKAIRTSFDEERSTAERDARESLARSLDPANHTSIAAYVEGTLAGVDESLATRASPGGGSLVRAALDGDSDAERALLDALDEQRRQRQLDVLDLVRADGRVLASAHWPVSSLSRLDRAAPLRAGRTGLALIQTPAPDGAPLNADGSPASRPALVATRALDALPDVFLSAGVFLDDPDRLRALAGEPDSVRLAIPGRAPILAAREAARDDDAATPAITTAMTIASGGNASVAPREDVVLEASIPVLPSFDTSDGAASARMATIGISRVDRAAAFQGRLLRGVLVIAALLVLFSFLLASVLARRFAAPIDALELGARAVAAGDLDHRVPLPPGGARNDELAALVDAFNGMSRDLKESRARLLQSERIAAWREIAQRIAHEIKNPLTPIQLAVETTRRARRANRADFDEIFEESAAAILEEVESLKKLVKEFSEFARMPSPVLSPDDVNDVVRAALKLFSGLPETVSLTTALADRLPPVALDREQLSRALLNLVANAADAVGERGTIVVRTNATADERGPAVEIHVADDGPGVPPEKRETIFTPYFTTKSTGTGLGLAIVQRIVTDHGGEIAVRENPPHGADFVVRLRVRAAVAAISSSGRG